MLVEISFVARVAESSTVNFVKAKLEPWGKATTSLKIVPCVKRFSTAFTDDTGT